MSKEKIYLQALSAISQRASKNGNAPENELGNWPIRHRGPRKTVASGADIAPRNTALLVQAEQRNSSREPVLTCHRSAESLMWRRLDQPLAQTLQSHMNTLLILGASGQVGQQCLKLALQDERVKHVTAPSRKPLPAHKKLINPIVNFDKLDPNAAWWQADSVLCALGTTMKLAGSKEAFYRVDHDYVLLAARYAQQAGARCLVLNSSTGTKLDASSYYLRVKAETERDCALLGFASLVLVRPSLLIAEKRPDSRPGEEIGLFLSKLFKPVIPKRLRAISVEKVARSMLAAGLAMPSGIQIIESEAMQSSDEEK